MARIEFLTGNEIKNFESVPEFKNSFERDYFFKLGSFQETEYIAR